MRKPMHLRRWSKGVPAYQDYLENVRLFSQQNIKAEDYVVVTGDVTHDMRSELVIYSLRWLRQNVKGTIILCRGNHDKYWDPGYMKAEVNSAGIVGLHIVDEGEMLAIGPYMFGCYSDHDTKTEDMKGVDQAYVDFGRKLAVAAGKKRKLAVFISHYPVSAATAEEMTRNHALSAYLSGHIHCTSNDPAEAGPDGVAWKWYNYSAAYTDDKNFNGCQFSTGTTDVLLAKHGQIFKEIESLRTSSLDKKAMNKFKAKAASAFGAEAKFATTFERVDPFNEQNTIAGFINRKKGTMQGSLYITHVNGAQVSPQLIYGTPKLEYPYTDKSDKREYKDIEADRYMIAEKWNGMNVCFFKYKDAVGNEFITAKSKGAPTLSDSELGNFLTLTKRAMRCEDFEEQFTMLKKSKIQSMTFELCGELEPHLVKYDFDICLKPLFLTRYHGAIKPIDGTTIDGVRSDAGESWQDMCRRYQEEDLRENEWYRKDHNLPHKYEYNHFITEGKVLYPLDAKGNLIDRTMYKIKPSDVEEVHWQTFDDSMKNKIVEAVRKIKLADEKISEETLMQELDMGPKEWSKFGRQILTYANAEGDQEAKLVVLAGLPGSGKSTVAKIMERHGWVRVNQDELGSRGACIKYARLNLKKGKNVVIDRCNFNAHQRKSWVDLAVECDVADVSCFWLDIEASVALDRASKRTDHPTIKNPEGAKKAIENIDKQFTEPLQQEGFSKITRFSRSAAADAIAKQVMEKA